MEKRIFVTILARECVQYSIFLFNHASFQENCSWLPGISIFTSSVDCICAAYKHHFKSSSYIITTRSMCRFRNYLHLEKIHKWRVKLYRKEEISILNASNNLTLSFVHSFNMFPSDVHAYIEILTSR